MSKLAGGVGENGFPHPMAAGILPVRVTVPAIGNTVTYTKTLPEPNTLLTLPLLPCGRLDPNIGLVHSLCRSGLNGVDVPRVA